METQNSPKWKTFLWRAISDILPTTKNLLIKIVDVNPFCAMCGIFHEDTLHALVSCDFTKAIWDRSNLPIPNIVTNIFHIWFSELLNVLDSNGIIYAAAILYHIWRARNGTVWDACLQRPTKVLATATAAMQAWNNTRLGTVLRLPTGVVATAAMSHPPPGQPAAPALLPTGQLPRVCRFDAGYHHATGKATVGAILLDVDGGYISAYSAPLPDCFSPLMAEAFACKEALSWLRGRGERNIKLYMDWQTLQHYLTSPPMTVRS
ncbi:PREDICTED: uncharacterized protein LOC109160500 [Ipomoea nil]|uniref:uncharacterized protein LOC109160500 n=1 Tax=Ipomoea nil TaxID=35883 RepID=UPI00090087F9|nr:PREDICTED: uncharacterized protein LOC109160500 [Ipomoea nil]